MKVFQSRLENTEQRLMTLQEEYLKVDRERDTLNDALRRFHSVISRSVIVDGNFLFTVIHLTIAHPGCAGVYHTATIRPIYFSGIRACY